MFYSLIQLEQIMGSSSGKCAHENGFCIHGCTEYVDHRTAPGYCNTCGHSKTFHLKKCPTCNGKEIVAKPCTKKKNECPRHKWSGMIPCDHEGYRTWKGSFQSSTPNGYGYGGFTSGYSRSYYEITVCNQCLSGRGEIHWDVDRAHEPCRGHGVIHVKCTDCTSGWVPLS